MSNEMWAQGGQSTKWDRVVRIVVLGLLACLVLIGASFLLMMALGSYLMGDYFPSESPTGWYDEPQDLPAWVEVAAWEDRVVACAEPDEVGEPGRCARSNPFVGGWNYMSETRVEEFRAQVPAGGLSATQACVPSFPAQCFRVLEGGLGVERSNDGGSTWEVEWAVSQDDAEARLARYTRDDGFPLVSLALAVVEHDGNYEVGVVSGEAGFAIRDGRGEWDLGVLEDSPY
jgi:hypothetical protein